jgi:hypothetical protein
MAMVVRMKRSQFFWAFHSHRPETNAESAQQLDQLKILEFAQRSSHFTYVTP